MLRKIRIAAAAFFFVLTTLLFLDFTGTLHAWFGWMAKIQFLPALLALNVGVVAFLVILTLLFGRVYCSVICPLGVMQDIVSWASGKRRKHRNRFAYSPALTWLRRGMLVVFVAAMLAGVGSLLAPYSAYGRIASNLLAPVYAWGNNLLAYIAGRMDSYAFYSVDVWMKSLSTLLVAVVTFAVLFVLAWRSGRTYCNTICPVGTVLGFLARYSLFKPRFDTSKCNGCKLCARNCKASCIDPAAHKIDYSRCVACMDCLENCRQGAITYTLRRRKPDPAPAPQRPAADAAKTPSDASRRRFLGLAGIVAYSALRAQEKKVDGGLAVIVDKKIPNRATPVVPPGAQSLRHFNAHCTGCQLCVSVCPNQVLRPSGKLMTLMQPGNVVRARILPSGVHEVRRGVPHGRHPPDRPRREIVDPDRPCRVDCGELRGQHRRRQLQQLCAPLPCRGDQDGAPGPRRPQVAAHPRRERRTLHRLRGLRESLSGASVQRHLCRRPFAPQNRLNARKKWRRKR